MCSPSPGKRRIDTDVIKLYVVPRWASFYSFIHHFSIESKHQVTLMSGLNEFMVKFAGPRESKY